MTTNSRIDELEARLAHQDQSLLELGEEVYRQQRTITELSRQVAALMERVKAEGAPTLSPRPEDEVPPHY